MRGNKKMKRALLGLTALVSVTGVGWYAYAQAQQHLAEAVASLETIRLGLLRLTTGVGTVQSFTTDLSAAAEVGDRIDRLMDGMGDVELLLRPT